MSRAALLLIVLSVTITAFAQIVLKAGMSGAAIQRTLAAGASLRTVPTILVDPLVFAGLVLYFAAAVVWLLVLAKVQVSSAYPFVALGFVLTAAMGRLFFHEALSLPKVVGTLLICAGVVLIARSG